MQFSFGKFTIAAQPFHFSMGFAVSPVFLQLRKGERQSGYSCVCFMKYSQFTDTVLLHISAALRRCSTAVPHNSFACCYRRHLRIKSVVIVIL